MAKQTRIPERMCVSCRQMKPKNTLFRLVCSEDGVFLDVTGKVNGRGLYVCKCSQCVEKLRKNKGVEKNYGPLGEDMFLQLEKVIEEQN